MDILLVIIAALAGSIVSLVGGLYLIYGKSKAALLQRMAVPFAAGALLAAAFVDLLPEALAGNNVRSMLIWALVGVLLFFVLERGLRWFHHHHEHTNQDNASGSLIIVGDTIHNFIDGLAIGAAFLVSPATGIVATVAVAAHEIPQELGDFALLLSKGMCKKTVLAVNIVSALATVFAAIGVYMLGDIIALPVDVLLAITAGFFIYIAVSDIIPTIHAVKNTQTANIQTGILLLSVLLVSAMTVYAHQFIDPGHSAAEVNAGQHDHEDHSGNNHGHSH